MTKHRISKAWIGAVLLGLILASCGIEAEQSIAQPAVPTTETRAQSPRAATTARPAPSSIADAQPPLPAVGQQTGFFLIDKLVRSSQLDGIDMHVRYLERTAADVIVHLSFYNNRGEDLAYVSGADAGAARLVGADTYAVSERSESLQSGIDPDGGWYNGGATAGTLTFSGAQGSTFSFEFPGFPAVELTLDQPTAAAPDAPPPAPGTYTYDLAVSSPRLENITLRIERAQVEADALLLTIAFVNENTSDITFTSTVDGSDGVIFDGLWQQYRPGQVQATLDAGIQPAGSVWGEGEANAGTLTFPLPTSGDVILFQFPSYPLVRIPLREGEPATLATNADLPPSVAPRPTPTAAPTATPLSGDELARQQINDAFVALSTALANKDRDAYLAQFAPELQGTQGELFDQINALPIQDITFEPLEDDQNGTLASDGSTASGYQVDLAYRVRDVDPANVFSSTIEYSLQQQGGRWLITEVGGKLPFWAYGPTEATRSGAFWIFYRPELAGDLPAIEQEAQQALADVDQALPSRAQPVNVMHVTATEDEFRDLTERSGSQFLGVASARYRIEKGGIQITSQAFFINGAAFASDPAQDRQQTITHELVHLVLSPQTMPYTPAWVSEGAAMWITDDLPQPVISDWYETAGPDSIDLAELSSKTSFGEFDVTGEQTSIDYAYAAYLAQYVVETYGEERFFALYDSFADVPFETIEADLPSFGGGSMFSASMGNLAQSITPDKVAETLNVDLPTLEREYETWLEQEVVQP